MSPNGQVLTDNMRNTYSDDYTVPLFSEYYKGYKPDSLPTLKTKRKLHTTVNISSRHKQYLNYCLRIGVLAILYETVNNEQIIPVMITIAFSPEYISELTTYAQKKGKNPISYYGELIKKRVKKYDFKDYFLVFEKGSSSDKNEPHQGIHVHIVGIINQNDEKGFRHALRKDNQLRKNKNGETATTAVEISRGYHPKIKSDNFVLSLVSKHNPMTKWREATEEEEKNGIVYTTIEEQRIDVGLADYLSKGLHRLLFENTSRNYLVSDSLTKKITALVDSRIAVYKSRSSS